MLIYTNLSLVEFLVRYLDFLCLFSVIDGFEWFFMGSLHKNIQLMQDCLKAPFLVLHFFNYASMTFLIMLYIILLSMLFILLSTLSAIRYLKCRSSQSRHLYLNI